MARVLVLNATYEPINVCTLRRAAVLLLKEKAELLERREGAIHSEHMTMERPDVIRLTNYVRIPREAHRRKITRRAQVSLGEHRRRLRILQPPQGQPSAPRDPHAPQEHAKGAGTDGLHPGGESQHSGGLAAVPSGCGVGLWVGVSEVLATAAPQRCSKPQSGSLIAP